MRDFVVPPATTSSFARRVRTSHQFIVNRMHGPCSCAEKVPVDLDGPELARQFSDDVRAYALQGFGHNTAAGAWEYFFEFRQHDGTWAVVCTDTLFNLKKTEKFFSDLIGNMFGSFGKPGGVQPVISRLGRYFFLKDKVGVRNFFRDMGSRNDLGPIIVGHGDVVPGGSAAAAFHGIAASL